MNRKKADLAKRISSIVPRDIDAYYIFPPCTLSAVLSQLPNSREVEFCERAAEEIGRELD